MNELTVANQRMSNSVFSVSCYIHTSVIVLRCEHRAQTIPTKNHYFQGVQFGNKPYCFVSVEETSQNVTTDQAPSLSSQLGDSNNSCGSAGERLKPISAMADSCGSVLDLLIGVTKDLEDKRYNVQVVAKIVALNKGLKTYGPELELTHEEAIDRYQVTINNHAPFLIGKLN